MDFVTFFRVVARIPFENQARAERYKVFFPCFVVEVGSSP
jgi:hypothetical protein